MSSDLGWLLLLLFFATLSGVGVQAIWLGSARARLTRLEQRLDEMSELVHTVRRLGRFNEESSQLADAISTTRDQLSSLNRTLTEGASGDELWLQRIRTRTNDVRPNGKTGE
jgi:hypothetical protein